MGHGDDLCTGVDHLVQPVVIEAVILRQGNVAQNGSRLLGHHHPGDQVGVVLHDGEQDLVPLLQVLQSPAVSHQVDAFGCIAREEDRFGAGSVDEASRPGARHIVEIRGFVAEAVRAPVDVGMTAAIVVGEGVDHLLGLLGAGGTVQKDQRFAVHLSREDGKILLNGFVIQ